VGAIGEWDPREAVWGRTNPCPGMLWRTGRIVRKPPLDHSAAGALCEPGLWIGAVH